ncbi:mechanosensitive ion channel family protein [Lyngbya confervoides]|uniref:Mechanosensitive ion channel family protein n=1 Tax=Lyngbya confervoides BDU141951 TaxID=1574623 RepID=A0ABD4SZ28_9CYAN|nr:mechanosensitive ion channel domain-containing protein [Lyngbya confervoides]MCM1981676.1 mechanosensitive ion channel family protein [Lyngbya confervoides BDU141951]
MDPIQHQGIKFRALWPWVLFLWLTVASVSLAQPQRPISDQGAAVVLGGETLFHVKAKIASFTPEFRAQVISGRIEDYAKASTRSQPPLTIVDNEAAQTVDILAGDETLVTIAQVDAVAAGQSRQDLARLYVDTITAAVREFKKAYSLERILWGVGYSLIATAGLMLGFLGIHRLMPKIRQSLRQWEGTRIPALKILGNEILSAHRLVDVLIEGVKILRLLLWFSLIYLYLNLVLSFFPWTRGISRTLWGYVAAAVNSMATGFLNYLPNLFFLGLTLVVTHYILKVVRFIFTEVERGTMSFPGFYPEWAKPTAKLTQLLILAFAATIAFPYLPGSGTPAFQGISIFLGLLLSLGSSAAIANVVSGTILTYTRAFKLGDRVKIGDTIGDVVGKTLFVTRVLTIKNVVITIPNGSILSGHIINYSAAASDPEIPPLILSTTITLGYDLPWKKVHAVLVDAALKTREILATPAPFVLQTSLEDFYVSYELNAYTRSPGIMAKIYSELHQNIQDCCNAAGIEILSPHYRAMRDGNATTIPADYLPSPDEAPGFQISAMGDPLSPPPADHPV